MQARQQTQEQPVPPPTRRRFFELASVIVGGILGLAPLALGVFVFLDPLIRKRRIPTAYQSKGEGKEKFVRVASFDALPVGDPPQRFLVIDAKVDSWNYTPKQPIGAIYMQRTAEDLRVFSATCPHLGCSVSCNGEAYHCPCHNSSFELDGKKRIAESGRENPSPRDLDDLEHEVIDGEIWVKYQNFYTGRSRQIPKT